ncbi:MAG: helix-hairpin-helix domain-containing protein [Bacteroidales bacterium]|nr:helix-hairpin-helix domain-containing protein [Bacteroidales bacterium]
MKKKSNRHKYLIHASGIAGILILLLLRIIVRQIHNERVKLREQEENVFSLYHRQNDEFEDSPAQEHPALKPAKQSAPSPERKLARQPTESSAFREKEQHVENKQHVKQLTTYRLHTPMGVELNTADSAELVTLYGIGPYYATKILEYRARLGGFAVPEQLLEIKGFDTERLEGFYDHVFTDTSFIKKLDLKTASEDRLANHLYIGRYLARCIVRYRESIGPDSCSLEHLVRDGILSTEQARKIGWYLH